ncbi:hypothetical protein CDD82_1188 [Ophiocordyceps australis]|uniref:Uncharacterized protein n=1 Tax=Ophiocordyceps australis TaxID=1399860 RepID=A0A2C5XZZ8_9HYPO|nr:hypothetical protein CDD82_1188 [Ophiocordyceps australis]
MAPKPSVPGLSTIQRHITGHNEKGESVFLSTDEGDHFRVMHDERSNDKQAVAKIIYSTQETPIELNGDGDIRKAAEKEVFYCPLQASAFNLYTFKSLL